MRVRGEWQPRLQRARKLYEERFEDRPALQTLSKELEKVLDPETPTSYSTVQRHFSDPGKDPDPELLKGLAELLAVREEWLLRDEGEPTREAQRRALRSDDALRAFRESVSRSFELSDAGVALLREGIRRWAELPDYMFEDDDPQEPEEALEELAEIVRQVMGRLPRGLWSERDWNDFSVALLGALMYGIKRDDGATPKGAVLNGLKEFVTAEMPEVEYKHPDAT